MQGFQPDETETQTFNNKVIYDVGIFVDLMYSLTINFYEKEVAEEDFDAISEDLNKLLTHLVIKDQLHFIILVLARIQT
jgi:hypothetical protein